VTEDREIIFMAKQSLGNGVFAEIGGLGLVLTTEHDGGITNTVVLKPAAWEALRMFMAVRTLAKEVLP
jgi:hypothetical protein